MMPRSNGLTRIHELAFSGSFGGGAQSCNKPPPFILAPAVSRHFQGMYRKPTFDVARISGLICLPKPYLNLCLNQCVSDARTWGKGTRGPLGATVFSENEVPSRSSRSELTLRYRNRDAAGEP
jgi:hypothetical protein